MLWEFSASTPKKISREWLIFIKTQNTIRGRRLVTVTRQKIMTENRTPLTVLAPLHHTAIAAQLSHMGNFPVCRRSGLVCLIIQMTHLVWTTNYSVEKRLQLLLIRFRQNTLTIRLIR